MKWLQYQFSLLDQQRHFDADFDQMSQELLILRFVWFPFWFSDSFILVLDYQCLVLCSLLEELHLMGWQNRARDVCSTKGWDAQLKQQWWGQGSSSKCPLILTAVLGSLKFNKVHSLQVIIFVRSFCWDFPFNGSPEFLLLLALSLICCSDQFLHQIQKTWRKN